jgi:NAD-dependent SIR2 family protein deacetylase
MQYLIDRHDVFHFQVFSGYRFVFSASKRGLPIAIVNIGQTRADDLATIKIHGQCTTVLEQTDAVLQERFAAS